MKRIGPTTFFDDLNITMGDLFYKTNNLKTGKWPKLCLLGNSLSIFNVDMHEYLLDMAIVQMARGCALSQWFIFY